jgi:hypothetical protein
VVDARTVGVDPDGIAAVAGHPELVARMVFALVGHPGMAQILGSTPNRRPTRPPAVAACERAASPPTVALQIDGTSRGDLPVVTRGAATNPGYFCGPVPRGVCPLQVQGTSHAPALPSWGWARPGMTGLLGTGPERCRSARPRVKSSGPRRVPPEPSATRNRCYRHPLPALRGRLPARQRTNPHEPSQAKALAPPGGPLGHL